jgi:hypothetical protein
MKFSLTSKDLETRYRKARNPIVVEMSGELTAHARGRHIQEFINEVRRCNPRKSLLLIAVEERT